MEKQVLTFVSKVNTEFEPHRASTEHSDTDSFNLYLISSSEELSVIQCLSEIKFSFSIHGICSQALTNDIGEVREREYVCRRATEREREREEEANNKKHFPATNKCFTLWSALQNKCIPSFTYLGGGGGGR